MDSNSNMHFIEVMYMLRLESIETWESVNVWTLFTSIKLQGLQLEIFSQLSLLYKAYV